MATTDSLPVHPSNVEALQAWDGDDGAYWAENECVFEGSVARYRQAFFETADIGTADHVLDVGCGTGQTTRDAARLASEGSALGVDLSSRMIEVARRRAESEGLPNVTFLQADAQVHPFPEGFFDAAISRTGTMFFGDPADAFGNICRALREGSRLTLLVWRSLPENHWLRDFAAALAAGREIPPARPGSPGPFSMADPDFVRPLLSAAGFADISFTPKDELMWFGDDADSAFRFLTGQGFARSMLRDLDPDGTARALEALRATIDAHETRDGVLYPSATWVIAARKR